MESDSLDPRVVNHLLDKAVATAARELLPCDSVLDESVAKRVVDQLEKLRKRKANFLDPLTPVLYSTWFQLGHVNLAVAIARLMMRQWRELAPGEHEMRVLDIGAGTLALPIAFDILRLTGKLDINVRMISIEKSREMEYCGRRIRQLFRNEVSWFRAPCDTTVFYGDRLDFRVDKTRFFASMHSMYPGIDRTFKTCLSRSVPIYGLVTLNAMERETFESLERDCLSGFAQDEVSIERHSVGGSMPLTFIYRRCLWEQIRSKNAQLGEQVRGLLTNSNIPVWPEGVIVVKEYSRKPEDEGEDCLW